MAGSHGAGMSDLVEIGSRPATYVVSCLYCRIYGAGLYDDGCLK